MAPIIATATAAKSARRPPPSFHPGIPEMSQILIVAVLACFLGSTVAAVEQPLSGDVSQYVDVSWSYDHHRESLEITFQNLSGSLITAYGVEILVAEANGKERRTGFSYDGVYVLLEPEMLSEYTPEQRVLISPWGRQETTIRVTDLGDPNLSAIVVTPRFIVLEGGKLVGDADWTIEIQQARRGALKSAQFVLEATSSRLVKKSTEETYCDSMVQEIARLESRLKESTGRSTFSETRDGVVYLRTILDARCSGSLDGPPLPIEKILARTSRDVEILQANLVVVPEDR